MGTTVTPYIVYILECRDGSLYTGITTDMTRRFEEHMQGSGAAYTAAHGVRKIVYQEKAANRSVASRREAEIKRMTRVQKLALCTFEKKIGRKF